jgi:hypothetical protein
MNSLTRFKSNLENAVGDMINWWNIQAGGPNVQQQVYRLLFSQLVLILL